MQGRVHYYEGYDMTDVVLPIRLMKLMGAKVLFLTNASGGIRQGFHPGDLMLITGQISSFVPSPLIGENIPELGPRFPDMSHVYDEDLQQIVKKTACSLDIDLREGVYIQLKGPNYETPQEIHMCRVLGADAVGMSTACEAVAANHMGMKIVGISCISNLAAGISHRSRRRRSLRPEDRWRRNLRRWLPRPSKTFTERKRQHHEYSVLQRKILTMEEEKQYRIAEGELWVKGNTICYIGDGSDVATVCQGDEVILWDQEIDAEEIC